MDNYSRAILASAVSLAQDTNAYLSVLHVAIERHGSPATIVTDGAGVFKSNRVMAIYRALGIRKEEIERRQLWQSFIETTFKIQRRMADFLEEKAESWEQLVAEHDRWLTSYNTQRHWAHEGREDGRRSPSEVLGPLRLVRHHPEDLGRAFFSTRFVRWLGRLCIGSDLLMLGSGQPRGEPNDSILRIRGDGCLPRAVAGPVSGWLPPDAGAACLRAFSKIRERPIGEGDRREPLDGFIRVVRHHRRSSMARIVRLAPTRIKAT